MNVSHIATSELSCIIVVILLWNANSDFVYPSSAICVFFMTNQTISFSASQVNFDIALYGTDLDTHYDYGSIMHYRKISSSAKNSSVNTITPLDATAEIGQREQLSVCDKERIRVHYGCKAEVRHTIIFNALCPLSTSGLKICVKFDL